MSFGDYIGDIELAELVWKIFCISTAESTKRTYSVSTTHFRKFITAHAILPAIHFIPDQLSLSGIILCFYTAHLFRLPSINSAATIENYSSQLRSSWRRMGVSLSDFDLSVHRDMKKGVQRLLPRQPDTRAAFMLTHYKFPRIFSTPLLTSS